MSTPGVRTRKLNQADQLAKFNEAIDAVVVNLDSALAAGTLKVGSPVHKKILRELKALVASSKSHTGRGRAAH